jgi:DNA primase
MRFPPAFLDDIRSRVSLSSVVGRKVAWDRRKSNPGRGDFWACCPFHSEKTPSFHVDDRKGRYHCFGCKASGDIFTFLTEKEGVSFPEAVERLAQEAGLPLPQLSESDIRREAERASLFEVMEMAAAFFEAELQAARGAWARGYLADRALSGAVQKTFRLGFAPDDRSALRSHLASKGVGIEQMAEAGLVISGPDIPVAYDRFRDRVMFPIADWRSRLIAFGGRALGPDAQAKYLNSPETTLFHKGSILFNGANARAAAHDGKPLIVVEGYIDVIAMVTAGFEGTVAPLGTALTEEQLALLWKIADEPVLCFDGDKAGRRAAYRAVDLALPKLQPGKSLGFAMLPEGRDPDDLIRSGGRAAMEEVLKSACPLADILWMRETESTSFDTPERRAALEARIGDILHAIGHEAVRKYYRQDFEARVRALFMPAQQTGGGLGRGRNIRPANRRGGMRGDWRAQQSNPRGALAPLSPRLGRSPLVRGFRSAMPPREALILLAVIEHPWLLETHTEEFAEIEFIHPDADRLRRAILDAAHGETVLDPRAIRDSLSARGLDPLMAQVQAAITHGSDWPARAGAAEADVAQWWAHIVTLHRKARTLNRELRDAERALGDDPSEANLAWIRDVQNRLAALEGTEALIEGFGASSGRAVRGF